MPGEYHLYLDESETHTNGTNRVFSIAGIIVKRDFHDTILIGELDNIKTSIWGSIARANNNYILHEKDIKFAGNSHNRYHLHQIDPIYHQFRHSRNMNVLYSGLKNIVNMPEITIIGACVIENEISRHYHNNIITEKGLIAMQVLLENFCHFLHKNNGVGHIFYESIGEKANNDIRRRFNLIEVMGTMYVSSKAIQNHIINMHFPLKSDNVAGLQIADFIPNNIARKAAGKRSHFYNLEREIRLSRYDGGIAKPNKFGVKVIPKV